MKSYKEYKQRKEAQKYFRKNNDQFLSPEKWIKTLIPGVLWSLVIGAVYGFITNLIPFEFSIFYLVIGIAIANILNAASGVSSPQIGVASVVCTLIAFFTSTFIQLINFFPLPLALASTFSYLFSGDILGTICIIAGCVVAYLQGSENRFM